MMTSRRLDPSSFRRATILVAEGDRGLRRALRDVLLGMGFPVIHVAGTMAEAQRQLLQHSPNVILLDHKLPGGDGIGLTRRLRRDRVSGGQTPIILMAEAPDAALVAAARDAGVNEIVVKPVSVEALVRRLMHVLQMPRRFIRSSSFVGPDRRRLGERRHEADRRQTELITPPQERRQRIDRRYGQDRRKPA